MALCRRAPSQFGRRPQLHCVDRVAVSDNLRYVLGASDVAADEAPLGKAKPTSASLSAARVTPPAF